MKEQLQQSKIIQDKYQLVSKLKSGGFGSVFSAKCIQQKNKEVAIKVISSKYDFYARIQRNLYSKIQDNKFTYGFIKNYDYFQQKQNIYLVLELLGNDLEDLMKKNKNRKFSLKTVLMIGLQVIDRLEAFHKIGYLHRDIKPQNLLIGLKEKNKIIYLIDFGMAKRMDKQRPQQKGKVLGSLAFMSCKAHEAKALGPSDDIESLIYTMLFMLSGTLPWLKIKIQKIADAHKILIMKTKISKDNFQNIDIPKELFEILKQLRKSDPHQKPDYLKIKYVFLQLLKNKKLQNDFQFDWCLKDNNKEKPKNIASQKNIIQEKMQQENQKIVQNQIYQIFKFINKQQKPEKPEKQDKQEKQGKQEKKQKSPKKQNIQRRPQSSKKIIDEKLQKVHNTKPLNKRIIDKEKQEMLTQVQLINSMKYQGPNIVINKTANHKI